MSYVAQVEFPYSPRNITFMPAGCIHWPRTNKALLTEWVKAVGSNPHAFTMLVGDSFDFARGRYRKHIGTYTDDLNSPEAVDDWVRRDVRDLAKILEPIRGKIIGVLEGNHYHRFMDGTNSEQELCRQLRLEYLGALGVVRVDFTQKNNKGRAREHLVIYGHHSGGSGGGRTHGHDMNVLARQAAVLDADIYVLSHTHDAYGKVIPIEMINQQGKARVVLRERAFIRTGCFMSRKTPRPSLSGSYQPSYQERAAYPPRHSGWVEVKVIYERHKQRGADGGWSGETRSREMRITS